MSQFTSLITSNYTAVMIVLMILMTLTSIVTVYFVVKSAVYSALKKAVDEIDALQLIANNDYNDIVEEYYDMQERVKKSHVLLSKLYQRLQ